MNLEVWRRQIAWLKAQDLDDDEAFLLSLESETDIVEGLTRLVKAVKEDEASDDALGLLITEYKARQQRVRERAQKRRRAITTVMDEMGKQSLHLPVATLSIRYVQHTMFTDLDLIPEKYRRYPPWEPMTQFIKAELRAGMPVAGCELSNPEPTLTIRVK